MSSVIIPNAVLLEKRLVFDESAESDGNVLVVKIPAAFRQAVLDLMGRSWERHGGYVKLGIDTPFRPRTRRGQGKFHALISYLAPLIDMSFDECKMFVKMEATAIGYPVKTVVKGKRVQTMPQSEADASTVHEHLLIETALKVGAESGHDLEAEYQTRMRGM
jgi:hypothetical protein